MSKIVWDQIGERIAETGVQNGVLYPMVGANYAKGVAWNGLTSLTESPSGAEANPFYADNKKYLEIMSDEEFAGTIGCYTYPDEFKPCIGEVELAPGVYVSAQEHTRFGLSYRNEMVNDSQGKTYGYKIHLVYNALAGVAEREHTTINDSPEFEELSFEFTTQKVDVPNAKPTAHLIIDSTKVSADLLAALEDILYGTENTEPRLPSPAEVAALFAGSKPSPLSLVSITPADDATDVPLNTTIVLTFNNKIQSESIIVTTESGEIVEGSKAFDASGKVITFTPAVNLDPETIYIVTVGGVVDIYNQTLASMVKNFATVG